VLNAGESLHIAWSGSEPALPHVFDQRLVALECWCFLFPAIWGFNARWLPVFLSLPAPNRRVLLAALIALHVWSRPLRPAKIEGVHRTFPFFVKFAYAWLLIAAGFWMLAAWADHGGGIWGAARHALTVGFITTMVFAIGQRVLPAFGGARVLYSPRLMLASLVTLTAGCALPVGDPSLRRILSSGLARAAMFRRN